MVKDHDIAQVLSRLSQKEIAEFVFSGSDVMIRALDNVTKLSLSTSIYSGGSYIPKSVRNGVKQRPPYLENSIPTFVSIDEENFRISLNYLGKFQGMDTRTFKLLLDEFSFIAEEWRLFLDDQDQNDRVHVFQRR